MSFWQQYHVAFLGIHAIFNRPSFTRLTYIPVLVDRQKLEQDQTSRMFLKSHWHNLLNNFKQFNETTLSGE